jgi:uncharacterized protein (DUF2267 family)
VKYPEFIKKVAEQADVSKDEAEALVAATLRTLGERITGGEADDLAAQLPEELKPYLTKSEEGAKSFGVDEFIRRVAERAGTDPDRALAAQGAIWATVRETVTSGELDDIAAQLPDDLKGLVGARG